MSNSCTSTPLYLQPEFFESIDEKMMYRQAQKKSLSIRRDVSYFYQGRLNIVSAWARQLLKVDKSKFEYT